MYFYLQVTRLGLADAGDALDDANFEEKAANGELFRRGRLGVVEGLG